MDGTDSITSTADAGGKNLFAFEKCPIVAELKFIMSENAFYIYGHLVKNWSLDFWNTAVEISTRILTHGGTTV